MKTHASRHLIVFRPVIVLAIAAVLQACAPQGTPEVHEADMPPVTAARPIADLMTYPQDLSAYAKNLPQIPFPAGSDRMKRMFYSAWRAESADPDAAAMFRSLLKPQNANTAENLLPWTDRRLSLLARASDWDSFDPAAVRHAVTVRPCSLRAAPTDRPRFEHASLPGKGYPFDLFQQALLPTGFPIAVFHASRDGMWLYAESPLACGWVRSDAVAFAGSSLRELWQKSRLAVCVKDNTALRAEAGFASTIAHIGAMLPVDDKGNLLFPVRTADGFAAMRSCKGMPSGFTLFPLAATPNNIAVIGNELIGEAYGWGGFAEDRDCSGMMRDLFAVFGVWLPKYSGGQKNAGRVVSLADLSAAKKKETIVSDGIPFRTLIYMPGHIGLYVGSRNGEPLLFHNAWGLATKDKGRILIGRAVITSLEPGKEYKDLAAPLIQRVTAMTILGE
ncbi:MAG: SH3 domain-containing protein [Mailhella sp.]|nr:SH3 domain-containing protein [Mailhella sp.]